MKYGEYLREHLTSEWSSQYISYDYMKELLIDAFSKASQLNENSLRQQFFIEIDQDFFKVCEKEAIKINTFFAEKLAEALLRFEPLKTELIYIKHNHRITNKIYPRNDVERNHFDKRKRHRKINDLKLAFSEFYLMLILLQNYQTLNFTGFRKILKKHDKLFETTRGNQWRNVHIDSAPFYTSKRIEQLMNDVEILFTNELESGDRTRAMQRLRVPPLEEKQSKTVSFRIGIFTGMLCLLIPSMIIVGIILHKNESIEIFDWHAVVHLYRSTFLIILNIIFFALNVYGWSKSGVNHVLIFELDPRNHLTYQKYLELGFCLLVIWCLSVNAYILSSYLKFQPFIQPLILILFLFVFLINPIRIFYFQSRFWLLKKFLRILCSPFVHVNFSDFWLADQLCSIELIFFDIEYFICFYLYDTKWTQLNNQRSLFCSGWTQICFQVIFLLLPSWFRFLQCLRRYRDTKHRFPHLVNAGKYASSFFVIIMNGFRRGYALKYQNNRYSNPFLYLWILTSLISSTYKLIWDFKMDWGFCQRKMGKNKYLREQIIYSSKSFYYFTIIENILFRFIWIINIFIHFDSFSAEYSDFIGFIFAFIELIRRFLWNYFRLENEHLNNCGQFRAVRDISIKPTLIEHRNNTQCQSTCIEMEEIVNEINTILTK
ncbi:hypothetical protein I4U23_022611 [Adineta vaga]|nr:hypothetical protein I4U23_022611 [Adineta vaga]